MLTIAPVTEGDRERLLVWRNQPDVSRWMYTDHVISQDEHDAWFSRMLADPTVRYWVLEWDSRPVGVVNLASISLLHQRCEWAIYLGDASARGTGTAAGAAVLSLDHAFGSLGMARVACEALAENHRAIALYERLGFKREGYLRSHVRRGDIRLDLVSLAILADDWQLLRRAHRQTLVARGVIAEDAMP